MASLKSNILLNGLNTATGILFPLVTFPYAARVMMPEGIGLVNFQQAIVSYLILLTSLGIPLYAVREIARVRDNKAERDKVAIEILVLSFILCILGYVAAALLAEFVPQIHKNAKLFYILSSSILFTAIGADWFYRGVEDFKFITIRGIAVRVLCALALFIFVKNPSDIIAYGIITVGATVGNNLINFVHLRKYIELSIVKISQLNIVRHIKPTLYLFAFNLIASLYVHLNSIMLGFITNDNEVGFFTAGTRITHVGLTIIASISSVLLPRCSNLVENKDWANFKKISIKSLQLVIGISLPMTVGLMILAKPVTVIFCGMDFIPSIPVLLWNAPVIIFIGITNLLGIQILYAQNKIMIVLISMLFGACSNLILNFFLIPLYGAVGAAISTFIAELSVLIVQVIIGKKYFPFQLSEISIKNYVFASLIMGTAVYLFSFIPLKELTLLFLGTIIGVITYSLTIYVLKDLIFNEIKQFIFRK